MRGGAKAISLFSQLRTARGRAYIDDLRRRLEPFRQQPAVQEFNPRANELYGAAA